MGIVNTKVLGSLWGTTKSVGSHYSRLALDPKYYDIAEQTFKSGNHTIFESLEVAGTKAKAANPNIFKATWNSLAGIPGDYAKVSSRQNQMNRISAKAAKLVASNSSSKYAKLANKFGFFAKAGTYIKPLTKRLPMIGNLAAIAFAIPNIYKAFTHKEGGIGTGLLETAKEIAKTGATVLGCIAGAAVGGPIGAIAGAMAVGWIADKMVGKSFSDQQAEKEAEQAEKAQNNEAKKRKDLAYQASADEAQYTGQNNGQANFFAGYPTMPNMNMDSREIDIMSGH